jgi:hypothetical protein
MSQDTNSPEDKLKVKRRDTRLESEGAEFLVLGNLLVQGVPSYKTYTNMPGYDIVATNPEKNTSLKIQVKSRYQTDWDGFIINNLDSDFVVLVALNRGYPSKKKIEDGIRDPDFYIFPIEYIKNIRDPNNPWGKVAKSSMKGYQAYENKWELIKDALTI